MPCNFSIPVHFRSRHFVKYSQTTQNYIIDQPFGVEIKRIYINIGRVQEQFISDVMISGAYAIRNYWVPCRYKLWR